VTEASSLISASATKTAASGKAGGRYSFRIVRCGKGSTRDLSETLAKPHQAGKAYMRRAKVVALVTSGSAVSGRLWDRRMRRAITY